MRNYQTVTAAVVIINQRVSDCITRDVILWHIIITLLWVLCVTSLQEDNLSSKIKFCHSVNSANLLNLNSTLIFDLWRVFNNDSLCMYMYGFQKSKLAYFFGFMPKSVFGRSLNHIPLKDTDSYRAAHTIIWFFIFVD